MMISTDFEARKAIIDKLGGNSATLTSIFQCELVILALYGGDPHNASNIFEADKLILSLLGGDPTKVNTVFEARKAIITRLGGSTIGISNNYEASLTHFELAGGEIPDITYYSVVFKNWDGTVLYTTNVVEGHTPIYNGNIPTRPSDGQYNYTFNGWTPSLGPVYGNIEYTASYTATEIPVEPVYYTVVFKNWDGTILQTSSIEEGQTAVYNGSTPARPSDGQYNYTFNGWLPSLGPVNENIEYTALYTATAIPVEPIYYTVVFKDYDGTILQTSSVEEGQTPSYIEPTPTRGSDGQYDYTFNGWTPDLGPVYGDIEYTALYTAIPISVVADYLKIDGATYVRVGTSNNGEHPIPNLWYSKDKTYWYDCWLQAGRITTVHCDGPIYFRGYNPNGLSFDLYDNFINFEIEPIDDNTRVVVSGNIMSLLDNGTGTITEIPNEYCFSNLFKGETYSPNTIYDASKLKLPNNTTSYCYYGMFKNCSELKYAPILPATTLADSCYFLMFIGCTNLTEVICLAIDGDKPTDWIDSTVNSNGAFIYDPNTTFDFTPGLLLDIPYNFTKIANNVLSVFFASAGSVRIAKTSSSNNYQPNIALAYGTPDEITNDNFIDAGALELSTAGSVWYLKGNNPNGLNISNTDYVQFDITGDDIRIYGNIMSLLDNGTGTITEIPNERCFAELFRNTPITRAPELPATTLTRYCYLNMFRNCTNLTNAPELPAVTLAPSCYQSMFNGCTNLSIVNLPATTLAAACYNQTFVGCTSLTNITLPAVTLADSCYNQMMQGCSSLNYIICLASDYIAVNPTNNWVDGVASTGFFIANFSTYLEIGSVNGIPAGWDYAYAYAN